MKARLKMKNRSYKYNINRLKPRDGHKYTKYKVSLSIMMVICIKQHVSNTYISIHEKFSNTEAELKKSVAYKKSVYFFKCNGRLTAEQSIFLITKCTVISLI